MRERRSIQGGGIQRFTITRIRIMLTMLNCDMFNSGTAQAHRNHVRAQQQHTAQLTVTLTTHKTLIVVQRNTRRLHRKRARQIVLNGVQVRDRVAEQDVLQLIAPPSIQSKHVFLHAIRHRGRIHRRNSPPAALGFSAERTWAKRR